MKGISIQQPWIDLILKGSKKMELRYLQNENSIQYRGKIALHASLKIDYNPAFFFGYSEAWNLNRGAILGIADLTDIIIIDDNNQCDYLNHHLQYLPINGFLYGLKLENVRKIKHPIRFRGHPGLFDINDDNIINKLHSF